MKKERTKERKRGPKPGMMLLDRQIERLKKDMGKEDISKAVSLSKKLDRKILALAFRMKNRDGRLRNSDSSG